MSPGMQHVIQMFIDAGRLPAALTEACRWGEIAMVRQLLAQGIAIEARSENGGTPLTHAASGGKIKVIELLLKEGADVNARDDPHGMTPLMWAISGLQTEKRYLAIAKTLLKAGADPRIRGNDGRTAFDIAHDRKSEALRELLDPAKYRPPEVKTGQV